MSESVTRKIWPDHHLLVVVVVVVVDDFELVVVDEAADVVFVVEVEVEEFVPAGIWTCLISRSSRML